jgi:signal transduction histidine kinase
MAKLIHHLIYLAKVDAKEDFLSIESFDLSQMIGQILLSFEAVIFEKNLRLTTTIPQDLFIDADKEKVKQVLMILLDNAIKNTPSGEEIMIHAMKEHQKVCYTIENTGVSIPKEQCNKIFERFYRIDSSRARESGKSGSYGLGLSIAKSIVDAHHGELFATSSLHSVVFTFCIPVSFLNKQKIKL